MKSDNHKVKTELGKIASSARTHGVTPAVDGESDAGAEGGTIGGEEEHCLSDLLRLAHAAQCVRRRASIEKLHERHKNSD